jgi:YesN/AraC family two-component response regulator
MNIKRTRSKSFEIIVVDDEPQVTSLVQQALANERDIVEVFNNGSEAREAIETTSWDLMITDLVLPDSTGLDLLADFMKVNSNGEAIIISGYATLDSALQAIELGAHSFLLKPFKIEQLQIVVSRALEKILLNREYQALLSELSQRNQLLEETIEKLQSAQKELIEKERLAAIGELMVTVRHQFKNALSGILGALEVIQKETQIIPGSDSSIDKEEIEEVIDTMKIKSQGLLDTIERISDLEKVKRTTYVENIKMVDLGE